MSPPPRPAPYDVAILGAGIAGSALAAILAKNGARTLLVDAGSHPRFSIGESTIPTTSLMWHALGQRFGVPELTHLAGYHNVTRHISKSCGIKKTFGFIHHRDGQEPTDDCAWQVGTGPVGGFEVHMFRQDVDAYVFAHAIRYGADARLNTRIAGLEFDDHGVDLLTGDGPPVRARFVVDGTGPGSPFARALGLRAAEPTHRTRTRCMFSHVVGVPRFDDCVAAKVSPTPFWEGTQHHLFDGGWFWIIPFDNGPESQNPLVSVGLTLDPERCPPRDDLTPEEEFRAVARRFPAVHRLIADARSVRPWVRAPRLQWSSTRTAAPRYAMMASTAGFVGPLFSLGLGHTAEAIAWMAPRLLDAVRDGDFGEGRFAPVEAVHGRCIAQHDALVWGAFRAFRDPDLWDAWFRVWAVSQVPREMAIIEAMSQTARGDREGAWRRFETAWAEHPVARVASGILCDAYGRMERFDAGDATAGQTADGIRSLFRSADLGPLGGLLRHEKQFMVPGRRGRGVGHIARWLVGDSLRDPTTATWARFVHAALRARRA